MNGCSLKQDAFASESQANRKHLASTDKAESDGHPQTSRIFQAATAEETVHAHVHHMSWAVEGNSLHFLFERP